MEDFITDKYCKTGLINYTGCRHSPTALRMNWSPILILMLAIGFLIVFIGGESAYSQCAGLCLYDTDPHESKTTPADVDATYEKPATTDSSSDWTIVADQTLRGRDLALESINNKAGSSPSEKIRVSQGLSGKFAINDMYSDQSPRENSDTNVYASNDAEAASSSQTAKSKDWEFSLVPYGWFTSISEDIVVNGRGASAHASFFDLLKHLDIAGMFHGEVLWKRKLGFFVDTIFSKLTINQDVTLARFSSVNANVKTTMFIQEFGGSYRVGTWPVGSPYNQFVQKSKPSLTFDILAGGRYWHLKNEVDIKTPFGTLPSETDQSQNWFDFIVGGRARLEFYKKLFLEVTTDIGGFDLSFSSKFSWNVLAVVGYELPWYRITPLIGYRALYDNYANGSGNSRFDAKTWMYGPALGVAFKF
jgi:hypothetical protein